MLDGTVYTDPADGLVCGRAMPEILHAGVPGCALDPYIIIFRLLVELC